MPDLVINTVRFEDVNLQDPFFDSLKESYTEFSEWFERKKNEEAFVSYKDDGAIQGFLYLKVENGPISDINPPLNVQRCLKVGTFKIDAHGTRLGERFVKIISDTILRNDLRLAYLTIFPQHIPLINILERFGFKQYGTKTTNNNDEIVYVKDLTHLSADREKNFPVVDAREHKKWILAIYPPYHTNLFPDSILNNENPSMIQDVSHTNSIYKVYIGKAPQIASIEPGDQIIMYRTTDNVAPARYRSVITTVCVAEEIKSKSEFSSVSDFVNYCKKFSVYNDQELIDKYNDQNNCYTIKMTYNIAFPRRITRGNLIDDDVIPEKGQLALREIDGGRFRRALEMGGVHEGFVVY